jgi:DNA-binding MarR family transcriptional regulator
MSVGDDPWQTAIAVLKLSTRLIDEIQEGVIEAGFGDVTPLHGFAFVRIASGDATTTDVAAHLGVTKQAAAQLVERLVRAGYVERRDHPGDHRSRLLALSARHRSLAQRGSLTRDRGLRGHPRPADRLGRRPAPADLTARGRAADGKESACASVQFVI